VYHFLQVNDKNIIKKGKRCVNRARIDLPGILSWKVSKKGDLFAAPGRETGSSEPLAGIPVRSIVPTGVDSCGMDDESLEMGKVQIFRNKEKEPTEDC
jgi:hypothetical protein